MSDAGETAKPLAVVTGAGGLIGHHLVQAAARWAPEWTVRGLTRADVDLTDGAAVRRLWRTFSPSLLLHCAALSRTGVCEQNRAAARRINVEAAALLAELSADVPCVFLSSDQVFDGRKGWYRETDRINPLNVYGETKAEAERLVLANPKHSVVRTTLTAGRSPTGDRSFVEDMRLARARGDSLTFFTDEFRCPISACASARAIWELVAVRQPGLYHLAGAERLSRWEIGQLLSTLWPDVTPAMKPGSLRDFAGPPRPADLSLDCSKLQRLLSFPLPRFRDWIAQNPWRNDDSR